MTYPPQPPQDPYGQPYGPSGPQDPQVYGQQGPHHYLPQPYSQPYQVRPYAQPYQQAWQAPQVGPVQWVTVRERGFNPTAFIVHLCLWLFVHWWLAGCSMGIWLLAAIPLTFIGWNVTRTYPIQNVYQPPYPPMYPR
ncbi:hypothetical protein [Nonomuraea sp. NPDC049607]|uniref:hypothetical protein n=1 Tax=Nonomuraea sp. NPDC049607 TaxID=3154732 RepID=UPI0034496B48